MTQVLRERTRATTHTALRYQCSPYHLNSALHPIIEQSRARRGLRARGHARAEARQDGGRCSWAARAADCRVCATDCALLSLPTERYPPLNLSPQKQKEKTLEALAGQVEALAQRQPLLMVFEDAHWIDPTSQELLDVLVPRLQALPILLVITYRPEYTPRWT